MLTGPKPLQAYLTYNIEVLTSVQGVFLDTLIHIAHISFFCPLQRHGASTDMQFLSSGPMHLLKTCQKASAFT